MGSRERNQVCCHIPRMNRQLWQNQLIQSPVARHVCLAKSKHPLHGGESCRKMITVPPANGASGEGEVTHIEVLHPRDNRLHYAASQRPGRVQCCRPPNFHRQEECFR